MYVWIEVMQYNNWRDDSTGKGKFHSAVVGRAASFIRTTPKSAHEVNQYAL